MPSTTSESKAFCDTVSLATNLDKAIVEESDWPLVLSDPKSVFYRRHADTKLHRYAPDVYFESRGTIIRALDCCQKHDRKNCDFCYPRWFRKFYGDRIKSSPESNDEKIPLTKRERKIAHCRALATYRSQRALIENDAFGINTPLVHYSLSRKKRWQLDAQFARNAAAYQWPGECVSTCVATSDDPRLKSFDMMLYLHEQNIGERTFGWHHKHIFVDRLLFADAEGALHTLTQPASGRGGHQLFLRLPPLAIASAANKSDDENVAAVAAAKRRVRDATKRRRAERAEGDPMRKMATRIVYCMNEPRATANLLNSDALARQRYRIRRTNHEDRRYRLPLDSMTYEEPLDFDELEPTDVHDFESQTTSVDYAKAKETATTSHDKDNDDDEKSENSLYAGAPTHMTLADFITSASFEGAAEDVEIWPIELLDEVQRSPSIDSTTSKTYVFVDHEGHIYC